MLYTRQNNLYFEKRFLIPISYSFAPDQRVGEKTMDFELLISTSLDCMQWREQRRKTYVELTRKLQRDVLFHRCTD